MKIKYNRFALLPHTCSKCEKAFWLEPYKHYTIEHMNLVGSICYVTNICKECNEELLQEELLQEERCKDG